MARTAQRSDGRRNPRRILSQALVRAALEIDPGALRAAADLPALGPPAGRPPEGSCLVCHSPGVSRRKVQYQDNPKLRKTVNLCGRCGYLGIDELGPSHYRSVTSVNQLPKPKQRMGTAERPGREFQMARMALEILGRTRTQDVLVYGAGRSLDNLHIQRLPHVGTVAIADIMQVRDDAPFVDVNDPGEQRFAVVVASEVVEHFRDPWSDFATLLGLVEPRGILVCGTNIHNGHPKVERDRYIYYPDHTSYYSAASIRLIAAALGFHVDFRIPEGLARRKRYLLFTRSLAVRLRAAAYAVKTPLAPSDVTYRRQQERLARASA